ncbi:hypothetical protein [Streptomyces sp. Ag109_G2-6]|uniref:hypothetical protein n=1 Tax=Streptomyces sp. Ag109_G2-6 TaxID=2485154 RepID=UPI000F4FA7AF|nr:hypothetical protein [Streptomyces sp. Ag109_G2-6]
MSQAKGTVRQLRMLPADMSNGRDRTLRVDGNAFEWIAVFLLDHPHIPQNAVAAWQPLGIPAIALTRRDWGLPLRPVAFHHLGTRLPLPSSCRAGHSPRR